MITKTIQVFDEHEEEFVNLLTEIGTKRTIARVLVYLTRNAEATSRDIERGTDLRQPAVSVALKYMAEQGWISAREIKNPGKGRPIKIFCLEKTPADIVTDIGREKKQEAEGRLAVIRNLKTFT